MASLDTKPPFKPKIKSATDVSNFDKAFLNQAPVDSFCHSKVSQSENGSYNFKGFEYNRAIAEKNETSQFDTGSIRSMTMNESVFDSSFRLMQSVRVGSPVKVSSFKEKRPQNCSVYSPLSVETCSTPSSATFGATGQGFALNANPFMTNKASKFSKKGSETQSSISDFSV